MRTILVATDLSAVANNAARYAADMAAAINAGLFLLHVYVPPVHYGDILVPLGYDTWLKDTELKMVKLKREILRQSDHPVHVRWEVRTGIYMSELKGACARLNPYAVVIGTTGVTATSRIFFGSHAIDTMKNLPWPVVCVPPGVRFNSIRKIGLACDFSDVSITVPIPEIEHLVTDFNAGLHILHIGDKEAFNAEAVSGAGFLRDHMKNIHPQFHFIQHEDVDEGILDFAQINGVDLLIILPKRHRFLDALVHRSHTRQFVLHHQVPLLAMHAEKKRV